MVYTHAHSAIKKNEILSFVITWVNLESTTLNEESQAERKIPEDFTYMWNLENKTKKPEMESSIQRTNKWLAEARGLEGEIGEGY